MIPTLYPIIGQVQNVAYTATAASSNGIAPQNSANKWADVRLLATTDCYYQVRDPNGQDPVVTTTTGVYLPGLSIEYIKVPAGSIIDAVRQSVSGTLQISGMKDVSSY